MKIIFLNIWHGHEWEKLTEFLLTEAKTTDVFCFVEVGPDLQLKLSELLSVYSPYYEELMKTDYLNGMMDGQSIFVKKGIPVENNGIEMVYEISKTDAGALQTIEVLSNNNKVYLGSIHGMARPGEKLDTPERLKQSEKIIEYYKNIKGPRIIGGDFNLFPDTKSVAMFEEAGYRDLIKEFGIKTTRNRLSWEQFDNVQYFADYIFVSKDVKVNSFEVPNIEISDHLPLILDIDI